MVDKFNVGTIVRTRNREWVVINSSDKDLLMLRPLSGSEKEISGIYLPLNLEKIESASFPLPTPEENGDIVSIKLLRDAARLSFRSGAGPFRAMGRISVRPRPYQFVPLLMALRQDIIRLLIADDVGVGKTVEALLIARELLDRGEIRSVGVVCPPHLCEQWQKELETKFNMNAVVIRSNTITQLERQIQANMISVFQHNPFFVTSIDYIKSDRRRETFLLNLPDLVIVDEAHTCTKPIDNDKAQQQRWDLINEIASKEKQNLIMLTATPHSGKEETFLSLIAHLKNEFGKLDIATITAEERAELAKYFVQRTRKDVLQFIGEEITFPERLHSEEPYILSDEYSKLFNDAYGFVLGLLSTGESLAAHKKKVRYWAALGLLRSIMSSPDAGISALRNRIKKISDYNEAADGFEESNYQEYVIDIVEKETTNDLEPDTIIEQAEEDFSNYERNKLREFANRLEGLRGSKDAKLQKAISMTQALLNEDYKPIIFCRFIATANYVAQQFKAAFKKHEIILITSEISEEEREQRIIESARSEKRILIATDCMSEGVNLQDYFDSLIHYDLPWNPNRLEQREGRIDRFRQKREEVKTIIIHGQNNPIDGAVLNVLIRKAIKIHKTLGISMPVPSNSETVIQSVINSLFVKGGSVAQLSFDFGPEFDQANFHQEWDRDAERELTRRTKFAQYSIKPEEVSKEIEETDSVLGDPDTVKEFIISATQRFGGTTTVKSENSISINPTGFEALLREKIKLNERTDIAFDFPIPDGYIEVGRNHPITSSFADFIIESAFEKENNHGIYRSCAIRTQSVDQLSTFYLLRVRYMIETPKINRSLMAEELATIGFTGLTVNPTIISEKEANEVLNKVTATENIEKEYANELIKEAIDKLNTLETAIAEFVETKAERLREAHTRLSKITKEGRVKVIPQLPADVFGIVILIPTPKGVN